MTKLEREVRRRERRRLADLNRNNIEVFKVVLQIGLVALAIIVGITIWFWAAAQQTMEVEAAVLRHHRITASSLVDVPVVEPLPLTLPEDGEPPQAIEIKMASKAEQIPTDSNASNALEEHWESLGVWKLTAYCPLECCNGKGNAWKTASGAPMVVGDTVAAVSLPYGTKIKIGDHVYTVTDTGRLEENQLDILHESHAAAKRFGIRYAEVFILR